MAPAKSEGRNTGQLAADVGSFWLLPSLGTEAAEARRMSSQRGKLKVLPGGARLEEGKVLSMLKRYPGFQRVGARHTATGENLAGSKQDRRPGGEGLRTARMSGTLSRKLRITTLFLESSHGGR